MNKPNEFIVDFCKECKSPLHIRLIKATSKVGILIAKCRVCDCENSFGLDDFVYAPHYELAKVLIKNKTKEYLDSPR